MFTPGTTNVIAEREAEDGTTIRIHEYVDLKGSDDPSLAQELFFAQQAGMKLRLVEIELKGGAFKLEPGALYFMAGKNLKLSTGVNGGLLAGAMRAIVGGETFMINTVEGHGKVYLEPSFGHFMIHNVQGDNRGVIVDRGSFYAGSAGIAVSSSPIPRPSGFAFGGEGMVQTKLTGKGLVIVALPVPESEMIRVKLDEETLKVDGNFAVMREERIRFTVTKSTGSLLGSALSGEGLLNSYEGTGSVWIAPTQPIYQRILSGGLNGAMFGRNRNNSAPPTRT